MYNSRAGGRTNGLDGFVGRVGFHWFLPTPTSTTSLPQKKKKLSTTLKFK